MSWNPDQPEDLPPDDEPGLEPEQPARPPEVPVGNYYAPPTGYGYVPPQAPPLPLNLAIQGLFNQYVKILTRPGSQSFIEEQGKADWGIIWVQLGILALIGTAIGLLRVLVLRAPMMMPMMGSMSNSSPAYTLYGMAAEGGSTVFAAIAVVAGFFITTGLQYLLAKAFRGTGDFKTQGYNYLLFSVPLNIISALASLIPILGGVVGLAVGVYGVVLNVFAIMATHRLSGGKASAVVLIPIGALLLFVLLCAGVALAVFLGVTHRI